MCLAKQDITVKEERIKGSARKDTSATQAVHHLPPTIQMMITRTTQMDPVLSVTTVSKELPIRKCALMDAYEPL